MWWLYPLVLVTMLILSFVYEKYKYHILVGVAFLSLLTLDIAAGWLEALYALMDVDVTVELMREAYIVWVAGRASTIALITCILLAVYFFAKDKWRKRRDEEFSTKGVERQGGEA